MNGNLKHNLKRTLKRLEQNMDGLGSETGEQCLKHSQQIIKGKKTTRTLIIPFDEELGVYPIQMIKGFKGESICPVCYKYQKEKQVYQEQTLPSIEKKRVQGVSTYLKDKSIILDKNISQSKLSTFKEIDKKTKELKEKAIEIRNTILNGSNETFLFVGSYGVGKSHLAYSIADSVNKMSYKQDKPMKCVYIQVNQMFMLIEHGYNLPKQEKDNYKYKPKYFIDLVKNADFIVIDDLGAELGKNGENLSTTDARIKILTDMFEAMLDKPKIVTTNLTKEQILQAYDGRLDSRLFSNAIDKPVLFVGVTDKRKESI